MTTIKLKINDRILDKVLWLLSQFNKEDVQILGSQDDFFEENKKHVERALERLESGKSKSFSAKEVDDVMENLIRSYESGVS